jgi:hypothetical protein
MEAQYDEQKLKNIMLQRQLDELSKKNKDLLHKQKGNSLPTTFVKFSIAG